MKKGLVFWVEDYFYNPNFIHKFISFLFLPLSWLYCFIMYLRFKSKKPEDLGIKVVSIGNLSVGGSGKTPLTTALSQKYENVAIVSRGYGRKSKGLVVVKDAKEILCSVDDSGDEAMIYAKKLKDAIVIVSEDRKKGILKAKEMGAKVVFLDDAYSKHDIEKLDLVITVDSKNKNCLPAGPYREKLWADKKVVLVDEDRDFTRVVNLKDANDKMSLVTAIAKPKRLDKYLPNVVAKHYFEDHHSFTKDELVKILQEDKSKSLLVTYKDFVKLEAFELPLSLLDLHVQVNESLFKKIDNYIREVDEEKN